MAIAPIVKATHRKLAITRATEGNFNKEPRSIAFVQGNFAHHISLHQEFPVGVNPATALFAVAVLHANAHPAGFAAGFGRMKAGDLKIVGVLGYPAFNGNMLGGSG